MIVICSAEATKPVSHLVLSSDLREQDNRTVGCSLVCSCSMTLLYPCRAGVVAQTCDGNEEADNRSPSEFRHLYELLLCQ
jgi:vacuolar-type H+-ATPase subunit E/Vma4